jgi:hypothetical protein
MADAPSNCLHLAMRPALQVQVQVQYRCIALSTGVDPGTQESTQQSATFPVFHSASWKRLWVEDTMTVL